MRYKRLLVIVVTVLFVPLFAFSASAADGLLSDWFSSGPYYDDFLSPAGENSVVYDIISSDGSYRRRYVFPDSAYDVNVLIAENTGKVTFTGTTRNAGDVIYMYSSYDTATGQFDTSQYVTIAASSTPSTDVYTLQVSYAAGSTYLTMGGIVTNSPLLLGSEADRSKVLVQPFPSSDTMEHKETQGMIATLTQNIKDWFSGLVDSMGNFFSELGNKIGGFFTNLGNEIGGFFTTLWNKIWWGNEAGESEYEPPDVGSKFDEVVADLNDWLSQLKGFSDTIDSQGDEVAGYLSTGSNFINTFLSVAPAPILIFLSFGVIFVVVRKVVGR